MVLIGCEGRGREAVYTFSAEGQYKLLLILPKMRCGTSIWIGFDMTPRLDRRPYCATDSRPYCTVIQQTILACADSPVQDVYWFKPQRRFMCCCNLLFLAKNRDSATMAMVPLCTIVHSQVAVMLPVGKARAMHSSILNTDG